MPDQTILAEVTVSAPRRGFAYLVLLALGAGVLLLAFNHPPAPVWAVGMVAIGLGALLLAEALRRATRGRLLFTEAGLSDSGGTLLVPMNQITGVSRGVFALKPSNGFVLILKDKGPRGWAPGLWWRFGRRFAVGGVVSAGAAKFMAETIARRINP